MGYNLSKGGKFPEESWPEEELWNLGERIRAVRLYNGLRQADIADRLGVHRSTYTYWETGKTFPPLMRLREFCMMFDVSMTFLLDLPRESNTPPPHNPPVH